MTSLVPFSFESNQIRVLADDNGDPWFVAADVCAALNLSNPSMAVSNLDDDEKRASSDPKLNLGSAGSGAQSLILISESGLYTLVLRCRDATKPGTLPHKFRKWVTAEVLPSIRKTGSYSTQPSQSQEQWEQVRKAGKAERNKFTDTLLAHGVKGPRGFATCTDEVNKAVFGAPAKQVKQAIALARGVTDKKKIEAIKVRDEIDGTALAMLLVVEKGSTARIETQNANGTGECRQAISDVGEGLRALMSGQPIGRIGQA